MPLPTLSIIMLVFNSDFFLKKSINSILNQTFTNFEFIIIDDGSIDNSIEILNSFNDSRIKILFNNTNKGIVYSRNKGLKLAKGKYIAMFDSDDIASPSKFEKQINFLENNFDYGMVGCWCETINREGEKTEKTFKLKAQAKDIPSILLFRNYFINSAVVFRKEIVKDFVYPTGYDIGEDYFLWIYISHKSKIWNFPEYLVKYRIHDNSITKKERELKNGFTKIFCTQFNYLKIHPQKHDYEAHFLIKNKNKITTKENLVKIEKWINLLYSQNKKEKLYNNKIFVKTLFNRWLKAINKSKGLGIFAVIKLLKSRIIWIYIQQSIILSNK